MRLLAKTHITLAGLLLFATTIHADTIFLEIEQNFRNLEIGALAWGDYNGDGNVDLTQIGRSSSPAGTNYSFVYKNNGDRTFTQLKPFASMNGPGGLALGDCDNDGDLDVLVSGYEGFLTDTLTGVYRNAGEDAFVRIESPFVGTPGRTKWADWDNDGDLDVLVAGRPRSVLYRNDLAEIGRFTKAPSDALIPTVGDAAFADYDLDGDLDLLIVGAQNYSAYAKGNSIVYRNENGVFEQAAELTPQMAGSASCAWIDIDNDGDPDPITAGEVSFGTIAARVYRNDRTEFVRLGTGGLTGAQQGVIACGDYDNDGYTDAFICGHTWSDGAVGVLHRNDQAGGFELVDSVGLQPLVNGWAAWGDLDNDTRLDIAQMGFRNAEGRHTHVFVNRGAFPYNNRPSAPAGLAATVDGDSVVFTWDRASDDRTPAACLTYSLRVGTTSGGMEVASPMSLPDGTRLAPEYGTVGADTMWILKGLRRGTYYWSVQSVDAGYLGSPFAAEETFSVETLARIKGVVATPAVLSVALSWLPVMEDDAETVRIYRASSATFADAQEIGSVASEVTSWTDTTVTGGQEYWYWLRAFDTDGSGGVRGTPVSAIPLLEGPTLLAPANGSEGEPHEVQLRWASLSGAVEYHVCVTSDSVGGTSIADTTVSDSALTLTDLVDGTTYFWRVRAFLAEDATGWTDTWRFTCGANPTEHARTAKQLPDRLRVNIVQGAGGTSVVLGLPTSGHFNLALYNARGALIRRVVQESSSKGWQQVGLDNGELAGGMYCLVVWSARERIVTRIAIPR